MSNLFSWNAKLIVPIVPSFHGILLRNKITNWEIIVQYTYEYSKMFFDLTKQS
jgi:hypothetical protein